MRLFLAWSGLDDIEAGGLGPGPFRVAMFEHRQMELLEIQLAGRELPPSRRH